VCVSGVKIPGTRSPGRLHFFRWFEIYVGPQDGSCSRSPFWRLEFWGGS